MPIDCQMAEQHPQRAETLRLLAALTIPDDVTVIISPHPNPTLGWRVTVAKPGGIAACTVPTREVPFGVLLAVTKALRPYFWGRRDGQARGRDLAADPTAAAHLRED